MSIKQIKISILIAILILGIVFPLGSSQPVLESLIGVAISFVAGFAYPYIAQTDFLFGHYKIAQPKWSDKLKIKNPLIFAHMLEFMLFFGGMGLVIGELIQSQSTSFVGLCFIAAGFGIERRIYYTFLEV